MMMVTSSTTSPRFSRYKSGLPRFAPLVNVLTTSRCGWEWVVGKSKLRRGERGGGWVVDGGGGNQAGAPATAWWVEELFFEAGRRIAPLLGRGSVRQGSPASEMTRTV